MNDLTPKEYADLENIAMRRGLKSAGRPPANYEAAFELVEKRPRTTGDLTTSLGVKYAAARHIVQVLLNQRAIHTAERIEGYAIYEVGLRPEGLDI